MHLFHLYHMMHYSLHLMFILLHPHGVPVSVCMCFACACLGDNHVIQSCPVCKRRMEYVCIRKNSCKQCFYLFK